MAAIFVNRPRILNLAIRQLSLIAITICIGTVIVALYLFTLGIIIKMVVKALLRKLCCTSSLDMISLLVYAIFFAHL